MRRQNEGFSLIELLVVITILAALAAGGTVFVRIANRNREKAITEGRLQSIAIGLEEVKKALGYYPPTYTRDLRSPGGKEKIGEKVGVPNETNVGIETVYIAFHMAGVKPDMQGLGDDALANTDKDNVAELVGDLQVSDLFEYVDVWGNPFVYLAGKDYKDVSKVETYVLANGTEVKVTPKTSDKQGIFVRAQSFQLFSMGPDGVPGTEDDLGWSMN